MKVDHVADPRTHSEITDATPTSIHWIKATGTHKSTFKMLIMMLIRHIVIIGKRNIAHSYGGWNEGGKGVPIN